MPARQISPQAPSSPATAAHVPVLLQETMDLLAPRPGGRYLDGTLGLGGHSREIMRRTGGGAQLCGLDRDPQALARAAETLAPYGNACHLFRAEYATFAARLDDLGWDSIDGALLDIGVSSLQLDVAERGFSLRADGPLDMRMDMGGFSHPERPAWMGSAYDLVNGAPEAELAGIIKDYGEDPLAHQIAGAIVREREAGPIRTTGQLAGIVCRAYPPKWRRTSRNHPATRTFQALRMAVNDELGQLERFLDGICSRLAAGGRLCIITFHSLEDRIVKQKFRLWSTGCICQPGLPVCKCGHKAEVRLLTKKPVVPGKIEIDHNPRAGSSKLRAVEKLPSA
ncbi:MAG: 16S rRNA (cytosine(1402)-N(4))-methyltransferase RsmH [Mailhella sp.]|nr:16S rRNA (cytosine(1402)-N(4))-methyltransferase RsmH [Mailhella sp.]